jgi:hypothetical protein
MNWLSHCLMEAQLGLSIPEMCRVQAHQLGEARWLIALACFSCAAETGSATASRMLRAGTAYRTYGMDADVIQLRSGASWCAVKEGRCAY